MDYATKKLQDSDIMDNVLKPGDKAPEFSLPDIDRKIVKSDALLSKGPIVLGFYRGVW